MCNIYKVFTGMEKHDDYMSPAYVYQNIKNYIPKDKVIWEAFYGDGYSGKVLKEMGFDVIHEPVDFFSNDLGEVVVSNPPFSKAKEVLQRLKELQKPFILVMPCSKINTQYFRGMFANDPDPIQIIIPRKRIHFKKLINGEEVEGWKNACCFDCFYYCWKMNLPRDIVWLTNDECSELKRVRGKSQCKLSH
tara:strand:+ start:34 stop:606 length:573 start_codon:yes stop_codon:yes gene_type:complete